MEVERNGKAKRRRAHEDDCSLVSRVRVGFHEHTWSIARYLFALSLYYTRSPWLYSVLSSCKRDFQLWLCKLKLSCALIKLQSDTMNARKSATQLLVLWSCVNQLIRIFLGSQKALKWINKACLILVIILGKPGEAKYTQAKLAAFEPPCKVEIVTYKRVTHYTHVRHHARPAILPHDVHAAGDFRVRSHVFIARQKWCG